MLKSVDRYFVGPFFFPMGSVEQNVLVGRDDVGRHQRPVLVKVASTTAGKSEVGREVVGWQPYPVLMKVAPTTTGKV